MVQAKAQQQWTWAFGLIRIRHMVEDAVHEVHTELPDGQGGGY